METRPANATSPGRLLVGLDPASLMSQGRDETPASPAPPPAIDGLEILGPLGQGGMGTVYHARQTALDRDVAVKVVADLDPLLLERLEREARSMASLRHPNLVAVHQFVPLDAGGAAVVMEFVPGGNLRDQFASHRDGLPLPRVLAWIRQIAAGLHAAHQAGLVHRDLKPENVLIDRDGIARLGDFGLALPIDDSTPRLTFTGTAVGTRDYLAPECFHGAEPDTRADLYALGVLLYEMLTGRVPRGAFAPPRELRPETPVQVSRATLLALRADPARRPPDVPSFLAILDPSRRLPRNSLTTAAVLATLLIAFFLFRPAPAPATAPSATVNPPAVPNSAAWIDLLAIADPDRRTLAGGWTRDDGDLISNNNVAILSVLDEVPAAYDVRLTFTRLSGEHGVALLFTANGMLGSIDLDGWGRHLGGVQAIDYRDLRHAQSFASTLKSGHRHKLLAEIRPTHVRVFVDGEEKGIFNLAGKNLELVEPWQHHPGPIPRALAIASWESPTRFHSIAWRPANP